MKAFIVGGGAREHAFAWKLCRDDPTIQLVAAPGNAGMADIARCVPVRTSDLAGLLALAKEERANLTIVGPEGPLAAGIVDLFRENGLTIFGPTREAAQIESSKRFAKALLVRAGVPTAQASVHTDAATARHAVREMGLPVVIKASGLAAGKGVAVCETVPEADIAIDRALGKRAFGDAGAEILVEEHMAGEEISLFVLTDGVHALPFIAAQDHKRLREGDRGPNTGGMGAYAPVMLGTERLMSDVMERIIEPTLAAMREAGCPFSGLLYAGLMLTPAGPKVVEYNCRFGDPETQAVLPLLDSNLWDLLVAVASGEGLKNAPPLRWWSAYSVATTLAAAGYPDESVHGLPITLPPVPGSTFVFHAGTARSSDGALVTAGGRVLTVTGVAPTLDRARQRSTAYADSVGLEGKQLRRDIGWREMRRHARAP